MLIINNLAGRIIAFNMSKLPITRRAVAYKFSTFRLDLIVHQLFCNNTPISLSSRTFDILKILVENSGQVVTKEELISQVWSSLFVEENNLTVRMSALRKVLGESAENKFIETVPGYGYRFVAMVEAVFSTDSDQEEEIIDSLAVLPMINENNQQKLNYLCDGVTESLINSLSHIANLRVLSYSTVLRYRGQDFRPEKAGEELGVRVVLVGKFRVLDNTLAFDIDMIDVRDGSHPWRRRYRLRASEILTIQEELLTIQEEIIRDISDNIQLRLSRSEESQIAKRHTNNIEAHHLYMKGRHFRYKNTPNAIKKGIRYLNKALKLDNKFALAYAGLADCYIAFGHVNELPSNKCIPEARRAVKMALELDDSLAEAYTSMGVIELMSWNWAAARASFEQAIKLKPYDAQNHKRYSSYLAVVGRLSEAINAVKLAQKLEPLSVDINLHVGRIYYYAREYDKAVRQLHEVVELDPHYGTAHALLGVIYLQKKQYEKGVKEIERAIELCGQNPEETALLGYGYAMSGETTQALAVLNKLKRLSKKRYVPAYLYSFIYVGLKDKDTAIECILRAYEEHSYFFAYVLRWHIFDYLKKDKRFIDILVRIGLKAD